MQQPGMLYPKPSSLAHGFVLCYQETEVLPMNILRANNHLDFNVNFEKDYGCPFSDRTSNH